jgi:XTP/dITP diphosphohydrolase
MDILLATANDHKIAEIRAILADSGLSIRTLRDFPELGDLPETGETFVDNALEKARTAYERTGLLSVADDSGIEVDALGGAPGVHSKRFSPEGTDAANNALLLAKLEGRDDRTARYRCVVAVAGPQGESWADGRCEGRIGHDYRGAGGFGYDPLFWPDETPGKTMAELTMAEKNAISHRGRAFRQLPRLLGR